MEPLISGTIAATGSFRCEKCGYVLSPRGRRQPHRLPGLRGPRVRSRLALQRPRRSRRTGRRRRARPADRRGPRRASTSRGEYLVYEADHEVHVAPLIGEWTRIGRSLAANVRFDDPTVSRRHALIVHTPEGAQVLDDRSLNGVFVNGTRVTHRTLTDGDEIVVGRYRLQFLVVSEVAAGPQATGTTA